MRRSNSCRARNESIKNVVVDDEDDIRYNINRKLYNQTEFSKSYPSTAFIGFSIIHLIQSLYLKHLKPSGNCAQKFLCNRIPSIIWIRNYQKEYILSDILSGITVGIMHIPQGMAYSLLATLAPINGLYTSFYPVLIYWIFGTSKQISMGTFAVISLMVASTITDLEPKYVPPIGFNASNVNETNSEMAKNYLSFDRDKARIMIAMANAFWVGVIQCGMSIFQLGFITSYLSEPLINSFLAGCSIHVLTSQVKFIFGLHKLTAFRGALKIPKTFFQIFEKLHETNLTAMIISIISITVLVVKIYLNERIQKKIRITFPIELIIVLFGTLISYLAQLNIKYNVDVIGLIPAGLPGPSMPPLFIIKDMILQTFLTAIIAFVINFSLADFFSKKHRYKINSTQELLAYGLTNIFTGFFPCFCSGASLARSCVQDDARGRTQMVSIYSSIIIGIVLLFLAPLFKELPQACLASIIIVALKTLLVQVCQLTFYWRVNKIEFYLFLITFLSTTILDVEIGLAIGLTFNIMMHVLKSSKPYAAVLGQIPGTELYKDIKLYKNAIEKDSIKIIRIENELHAMNSAVFKKLIYELSYVNPTQFISIRRKIEAKKKENHQIFKLKKRQSTNKVTDITAEKNHISLIESNFFGKEPKSSEENYWTEYERNEHEADIQTAETESQIGTDELKIHYENYQKRGESVLDEDDESRVKIPFEHLIIDCSPIYFIDTVGCKTIKQLVNDFNEIGVNVYLAECSDGFRDRFEKFAAVTNEKLIDYDIMYLSVHDACLKAVKVNNQLTLIK